MTEGKPRPWEQGQAGGSFGSWLRRQREVREISLREISDISKISLRYLEALEQDRFEILPNAVFTRGFLREYARFVGLDPDEVVNYFLSLQPDDGDEEAEGAATAPRRVGGKPLARVVAVVVVVLAVLGGILWFLSFEPKSEEEVPPMAPPSTQAVPTPEPSEPAGPKKPIRLSIDFDQKSWVEAFVDGVREVSELRVQGESLHLEASKEIRLVLNNAAGVSMELNGAVYEPKIKDDEPLVIDLSSVGSAGVEDSSAN